MNQTYRCPPYIGIMEKRMETTGIIGVIYGLCRGYIGIMEKKMETTIHVAEMCPGLPKVVSTP